LPFNTITKPYICVKVTKNEQMKSSTTFDFTL